MNISKQRQVSRQHRHERVRTKVSGSSDCPRLAVYRSNNHIYAQVIDDNAGNTIASASSLDAQLRAEKGNRSEIAKRVGQLCADRAKEKGVTVVVFDRGGYLYHGRVAALAEGARENGLDF